MVPRRIRHALARSGRIALVIAALGAGLAPRAAAHDIPSDVTIQTFFKPEGTRLRLLVRVPMEAMRDMDYPRRDREFVDLPRVDSVLRDAATLWIADDLEVYEGERLLPYPSVAAVRASLAGDRSFGSYEDALAHVTGPPLPPETEFIWNQGLLDILFEYSIAADRSRFSIRPKLGRLGLRTLTIVRFLPPDGTTRSFELVGEPGLVRLDPTWYQAAGRFVAMGFRHILDGPDHLLFLFCLVVPFRRLGTLAAVVTAFTVAHTITLVAAAYGFAPDAIWFPTLVDMLIAASIFYLAVENMLGPRLERRWLLAFGFGLIHGLAFAFVLRQTFQFAGAHLATSLVAFNIGLELAQLLVVAVMVPAIALLFRFVVSERIGTIVVSALAAHVGWHWTTDRVDRLSQYSFRWPGLTVATLLAATRLLMVAVVLAGAAWILFGVLKQIERQRSGPAKAG